MQSIGGLQALRLKMLEEMCCITGKKLTNTSVPAIIRIERADGVIMTVDGSVVKSVRKGTKYYLGGKVISVIRANVVMTIERNRSGQNYASCVTKKKRIARRGENMRFLSSQPKHIQRNVAAKRIQLQDVWNN